jgi:predicted DNA-binding protein
MSSYPHSFPLRLNTDLSNTLHSASLSTGITKSDLIRVALNKFLVELSQSGITEAIAKIKGS